MGGFPRTIGIVESVASYEIMASGGCLSVAADPICYVFHAVGRLGWMTRCRLLRRDFGYWLRGQPILWCMLDAVTVIFFEDTVTVDHDRAVVVYFLDFEGSNVFVECL